MFERFLLAAGLLAVAAAPAAAAGDPILAISGQPETLDPYNTNTTLTEIAPYVAVARAYGVEPEVRVWCGEAPAHALTRNSHGVPPEVVKAMWGRMNDTFTNWPRFWPAPIVMRVEG